MKLIVGLGNPGARYQQTRHNAGFMVLDRLASKHASGGVARSQFNGMTLNASVGGEKCVLLKPMTFMNRSGQSVGEAVRFFKLNPSEDLLVIVDDIAFAVGMIRVRAQGSSGGHNGLSDIDRALGGESYPRVRVGVGVVPPLMDQADWVLSRFMKEEEPAMDEGINDAARAVECIVSEGVDSAMNRFNRKESD